jgi:phosphoglycolate phosphatase-like HAD superfamily hydrolase
MSSTVSLTRAGHALGKIGLPASQAVMVGDTPCDAEAALEAGAKAAGVLTGGFSAAALFQAGLLWPLICNP